MTKTVALLLAVCCVALVIIIAILVRYGCSRPLRKRTVEITAPKNTQVYWTLSSESEKYLGGLPDTPLTLDVRVDATIILRYKEHQKSFPPAAWENGKIFWQPKTPQPIPTRDVTVSVNAVPWARVFIKLPGSDRFIKPPGKRSNVTPIRGPLKIPVGTAIRLEYEDKEKTFEYDGWKTSKTVSHDFLNP